MSDLKIKMLEKQVEILTDALNYYKNLDIRLVKNYDENLETSTGEKFSTDEEMEKLIDKVKTKFAPSPTKRINYNPPNLFLKKAKYALNKVEMMRKILDELDGGQQILVTDEDLIYSNETFIDHIPHDLVIDGSLISSSQNMYETICEKLNINPDKRLVVIVTNYAQMINKMNNEEMRDWVCDLRNTMENREPLLFVLLNADDEDRTFMSNNELVSRLIPFYN